MALWIAAVTAVHNAAAAETPIGIPSQAPLVSNSGIEISFDYESARAVLDLFDAERVTDEDLSHAAELPGNLGLIRQAARFSPKATKDKFRESLREILETGSVEDDVFRFVTVRQRLEKTRKLLEGIERDPVGLKTEIAERIEAYLPAGLSVSANVHFLLGGTSDGFAPSADTFYVALHYFEDDIEGLKVLMAHELYHIAQSVARTAPGRDAAPDKDVEPVMIRSLGLLRNTMNEGTASLVGDPLIVKDGGKYTLWFQTKYRRNLQRIKTNFALFDALLFRLFQDPDADPNELYMIGFSGMWDSPLYFVGYHMAKAIEKHDGREAVAAAMEVSPIRFFGRYIELCRTLDDPEMVRFSRSTEDILVALGYTEGSNSQSKEMNPR
jgi:hypothetical protein